MRFLAPLLLVAAWASYALADPAGLAVSEHDVRVMFAQIPPEASLYGRNPTAAQPAGFRPDSDVVAAIAGAARSRNEAALMSVFAAYESGGHTTLHGKCVAGDGGKSYGAWQLRYAGSEVACDAGRAVRWWRSLLGEAARRCPSEPLAPVVGSCTYEPARRKAHARQALANRLAAE